MLAKDVKWDANGTTVSLQRTVVDMFGNVVLKATVLHTPCIIARVEGRGISRSNYNCETVQAAKLWASKIFNARLEGRMEN